MASLIGLVGYALRGVRPGLQATASAKLGVPTPFRLSSPAFADGQPMPRRFTADGEGVSPPLEWSGLPPGTRSLALLVEDADAPFPRPLVHLVLYGLPAEIGRLAEGAVPPRQRTPDPLFEAGRNSYFRRGWLPPSPVPGHGSHRYVFQLFALRGTPGFARVPGRSALVRGVQPMLLALGQTIGTYERA